MIKPVCRNTKENFFKIIKIIVDKYASKAYNNKCRQDTKNILRGV